MTTHLRDEIASFHSVCEQSLSTFRGWITGHEAHLAVFHRTSDPMLADDIIKRADSIAAFAIAADAANLLMLVLGSDLHKQGFNLSRRSRNQTGNTITANGCRGERPC